MKKNTQITLNVTLDENNNPIQMTWSAPDGGIENYDMDAFFLSTWNKTNQETSRIDLWIKKMSSLGMINPFFIRSIKKHNKKYLTGVFIDIEMYTKLSDHPILKYFELSLLKVKQDTPKIIKRIKFT